MSQIIRGISAVVAVSLTFGAVQLASGHDLIGRQIVTTTAPETGINRAAKADRAAAPASREPSRTVALRFENLAETSVVIRMPAAEEARSRPAPPSQLSKSGDRKAMVACEPVVSVLTEIAKRLQPGRCVT